MNQRLCWREGELPWTWSPSILASKRAAGRFNPILLSCVKYCLRFFLLRPGVKQTVAKPWNWKATTCLWDLPRARGAGHKISGMSLIKWNVTQIVVTLETTGKYALFQMLIVTGGYDQFYQATPSTEVPTSFSSFFCSFFILLFYPGICLFNSDLTYSSAIWYGESVNTHQFSLPWKSEKVCRSPFSA